MEKKASANSSPGEILTLQLMYLLPKVQNALCTDMLPTHIFFQAWRQTVWCSLGYAGVLAGREPSLWGGCSARRRASYHTTPSPVSTGTSGRAMQVLSLRIHLRVSMEILHFAFFHLFPGNDTLMATSLDSYSHAKCCGALQIPLSNKGKSAPFSRSFDKLGGFPSSGICFHLIFICLS